MRPINPLRYLKFSSALQSIKSVRWRIGCGYDDEEELKNEGRASYLVSRSE
jgi:hypothetical protein